MAVIVAMQKVSISVVNPVIIPSTWLDVHLMTNNYLIKIGHKRHDQWNDVVSETEDKVLT